MGFMNQTFYLSLLVCLACGCGKSVEDKEAEFSGYRDAAEMKSDSAQRNENQQKQGSESTFSEVRQVEVGRL